MPTEASISNEELLRRLKEHNYSAPPITPSTRGVLIKKLTQLDNEKKIRNRLPRGTTATNGNGTASKRNNLLDYSSGEEDIPASTGVRKRTTNNFRTPAVPPPKSSVVPSVPDTTSKSNGHQRQPPGSGRLMNYSETEDDDEEFEDEDDIDDDEDDDDDEDIEDEEEEEEDGNFRDLAVQTSPRLDDTSANEENSSNRDQSRYGLRFKSSTPIPFIKSTSNFLSSPTNQSSRPKTSTPNISLASPLRRAIAQNERAFGSLGEALDSLPRLSVPISGPSTSSSTSNNTSTSPSPVNNGSPRSEPKTSSIPSRESKTDYLNKNSGICNSHFISKLIILVVCLFFLFLFYKYTNLRPHFDVKQKLPICNSPHSDLIGLCFNPDQLDDATEIYKRLVDLLDEAQTCPDWDAVLSDNSTKDISATLKMSEIRKALSVYMDLSVTAPEVEDDGPKPVDLLQKLILILDASPELGIGVVTAPEETNTEVYLLQPRMMWGCWFLQKLSLAYQYGTSLLWWALLCGLLFVVGYLGFKIYIWNQDRLLREKQDVFELVEQVLSLLVNQHQAALRGGVVARPFLAINHVRDQLIPPQDRKRKRKLWLKVEKYINESESRVREETQSILGEDHRVWRWIPEIGWATPINPNGPNPYMSPTAPPPTFSPPTTMSPFMSSPATSTSSSSSSWQGSAFTILNKNVAAPPVAPTSCLKVRHMFDRQSVIDRNRRGGSTTAWIWQIKEEVLLRCANAQILHIAVDTESTEGCVYIKAQNTGEASKVFSALHGQWYGGNLITVKYMREERYQDRFPDSRHQVNPLKPAGPKLKPL